MAVTPEPLTAREARKELRAERSKYAVRQLLYDLRKFVRAVPLNMADEFPPHTIEWTTEPGHMKDPGSVIMHAVGSNPDLWAHALPDDVCIVPRAALTRVGLTTDAVAMLHQAGVNEVLREAQLRQVGLDAGR